MSLIYGSRKCMLSILSMSIFSRLRLTRLILRLGNVYLGINIISEKVYGGKLKMGLRLIFSWIIGVQTPVWLIS